MAYETESRGKERSIRAHDRREVVTAVAEWAVSRGWTTLTDADGCCHFYDPHGEYIAYWPLKMSSGAGHRW